MTSKKMLTEIQENILKMLKEKLPSEFVYHNYEHTLDVMQATERIAKAENTNEDDLMLLKTAAAFHDTGYLLSHENHEEQSCRIAREFLSSKGVDKEDIEKICGLILATKVPHKPKNKLDEIICDADLDYLGRDDYFPIAKTVYKEFKHFGIVKDDNEWKEMQVKFLESHKYFTETAKKTRSLKKEEHLMFIKNG